MERPVPIKLSLHCISELGRLLIKFGDTIDVEEEVLPPARATRQQPPDEWRRWPLCTALPNITQHGGAGPETGVG
jgi:hypothetical protein